MNEARLSSTSSAPLLPLDICILYIDNYDVFIIAVCGQKAFKIISLNIN